MQGKQNSPTMTDERNPEHFLSLIKKSRRGKFKLYIGMVAGVGKTYRMLQEAHALRKNGVDARIGYIETHRRKETHALLDGLPEIPRRKIFYKGKELEEMDVQAILNVHPELVLVDELAHTNIPGSKHEKRWQDVVDILESGINVISAVNIQHLESLNDQVKHIAGLEVAEARAGQRAATGRRDRQHRPARRRVDSTPQRRQDLPNGARAHGPEQLFPGRQDFATPRTGSQGGGPAGGAPY